MGSPTLLATLAAAAVGAGAPRVASMSPAQGDPSADPAIGEIRVTFDTDMAPSWAWAGGGPAAPTITGSPRWEGRRTCVLPVSLEPARTYALSINGIWATGFAAADGTPVEPAPILFRTAGGPPLSALDADTARASVDELRRAIDGHYSYRDRLGLDWPALFEAHRPQLESAGGPLAFALAVHGLLAPTRDQHIAIEVDGASIGVAGPTAVSNVDERLLRRVVPGLARRSEVVATGRFDDGIGYILIGTWQRSDEAALEAAHEALGEFADAPGLIIDVRPNGGGDETLAQRFAGRFAAEPRVYASHATRTPEAPGGWTAVTFRTLEPVTEGPTWRGPVCVLMGGLNMSSCEAFLLMMRQVEGCTLVGARSYGSSGNPLPYELPAGVTVMLPCWRAMDAAGARIEGVGVEPDVLVEPAPGDRAMVDRVLARALAILRR